jgi:hypothetical protein
MPHTLNAGNLLNHLQQYVDSKGPDQTVFVDTDEKERLKITDIVYHPRNFIIHAPNKNIPDEGHDVFLQKKVITQIHESLSVEHIEKILEVVGLKKLLVDLDYIVDDDDDNTLPTIARDIRSHLDEDFFLSLLNLTPP